MGVIDGVIGSYFCFNQRIAKTKQRMIEKRKNFYNQTLVTHTGYRDDQPATISFNLETEVVNYVAALEVAEEHIKVLEFKQRYFKRFLDTLDKVSITYYKERYLYEYEGLTANDSLDRLILSEVKEIEEATKHCFKVDNDSNHSHKEEWQMRDEKILTDFNKMLELLGV